MPTSQKKRIHLDHFHMTQQLGFKPVLYCWCGAKLDLNLNKRSTIHRWMDEHEACEMPKESKQAV